MRAFLVDEEFQFYKEVLSEGLTRYGAQLHAYSLTPIMFIY